MLTKLKRILVAPDDDMVAVVDATVIVETILANYRLAVHHRICVDADGLPGCQWKPGRSVELGAAHRRHRAELITAAIADRTTTSS